MGILALAPILLVSGQFWAKQLDHPRVWEAWEKKGDFVQRLCKSRGVPFPPNRLLLRAMKLERQLEVWAGPNSGPLKKLKTYEFSAYSGSLGPKRRKGDRQIPEGFYGISQFNPQSKFWLSLRVDYPNASDRILSDQEHPGGDIFIHGGNKSIGCIPITDDGINEVYILAARTVDAGGHVDVHIYPTRMVGDWAWRIQEHGMEHMALWKQLATAYTNFEKTHLVPKFSITKTGRYIVR